MQLPTILLVFSILTSRLPHRSCTGLRPVAAQEVKQKLFQKLPFDDFVGTPETHTKETAASDVDCARQCDRAEGCVMFTFLPSQNVLSGECWMYEQLVNSTVGWERRAGAENYGLKGSAMTCVDGYVPTCDRCLKYDNSSKNFSEARDICMGQDQGHLVVAKSEDDLTCFKSFVKSNGGGRDGMWLGLDDMAEEGKFVWHDGTILPRVSSMWMHGEPGGDVIENCVRVTFKNTKLHDYPCYSKFTFMCQTDPH